MDEIPRTSPREERAFWDDRFARERRVSPVADHPIGRVTEAVTERLRVWREDARFGVVVLILVALVAGVVWYRIGVGGASAGESPPPRAARSSSTRVSGTADATATGGSATSASASASASAPSGAASKGQPARLAVHVAGAVVHPGVVEVAAGSRVIDAIEAVGGALPTADLDRLNLAAKVVDGERVYVAKPGEADPGASDGTVASAGGDPGSAAAPGAKVNLNTASEAQLETLPGIGPSYAQSIIAERQRRGGFKSVNDLRSVHGIGDKRFAQLAPLVTV